MNQRLLKKLISKTRKRKERLAKKTKERRQKEIRVYRLIKNKLKKKHK
jgi:hypothetical protein